MKRYRIEAEPAVEADVEAAFDWYEIEEPGLGLEFLEELRAAYHRILDSPLGYQELRFSIRRALTRRFPYAIYFSVEDDIIIVVAVLHTARDTAAWQLRIGGNKE
ncbi:MAG TPA: type II toxin-antitoxin system RelE/ParE family toxin [Pyrinomonadaceae bacterium]|nr:type II toxin-antitoxin system RelE/ParE family toxin [Pyrinomonadaceae bacterium]